MNTLKKIDSINNISRNYIEKLTTAERNQIIENTVSERIRETLQEIIFERINNRRVEYQSDYNVLQSLEDAISILPVYSVNGEKMEGLVYAVEKKNGFYEIWKVTDDAYVANFDITKYYPNLKEVSVKLVDNFKECNYLEDDIKALKKRIKHAKSLLEQKALQKQLNEAYKKAKRKKH